MQESREMYLEKTRTRLREEGNIHNPNVLMNLIQTGIFRDCVDLYSAPPARMPLSYFRIALETAGNWINEAPAAGIGTDLILSMAFLGGLCMGPIFDKREKNHLDHAAKLQLFLTLDKMQTPKQRKLFIQTVVSLYKKDVMLDTTLCKMLIQTLESHRLSLLIKWNSLLRYLVEDKNNGAPFYSIIADRNCQQDWLGYKQFRHFTLFAKMPKEVQGHIKEAFVRIVCEQNSQLLDCEKGESGHCRL